MLCPTNTKIDRLLLCCNNIIDFNDCRAVNSCKKNERSILTFKINGYEKFFIFNGWNNRWWNSKKKVGTCPVLIVCHNMIYIPITLIPFGTPDLCPYCKDDRLHLLALSDHLLFIEYKQTSQVYVKIKIFKELKKLF